MKRIRSDREKFLADVLHDDWSTGTAAKYAMNAAAFARRRRRAEKLLAAGSVIAAITFLAVARTIHVPTLSLEQPKVSAISKEKLRGYEILSDRELFAALSDRSVLLVEQPKSRRELVLLDH